MLKHFLHRRHFQSPTSNPSIIKHCIALLQSRAKSPQTLKQIHAFSIKNHISISNLHLGKHLIFFYVALSLPMNYARNLFDEMRDRSNTPNTLNVFVWNTMIKGYAESEAPREGVVLYGEMVRRGGAAEADLYTYTYVLKAAAKGMDGRVGECVHCVTVRDGFDGLVFVANGLVNVYAVCGRVVSARKVFDEMGERNLVSWNSVINGVGLNGRPDEVLELVRGMVGEGVVPDGFTMVSLLTTCAEMGALALGRRVHGYMVKVGLDGNLHAGNALLDCYAKCGRIREAGLIFREFRVRTVVSWTSLIVGLAVNGFGFEAIELFKKMEAEGLVPTDITFVGVLYACSHCGMVDEGLDYLNEMEEKYGILPKIEHYGCIVDGLGRAGKVREAYKFILTMPLRPSVIIWRSLLGASSIHGYPALAEAARAEIVKLEPKHCGDYVLLSNLYASEKRWSDVQKVRKRMFKDGVNKIPGYSLVELRNRVYEFIIGDKSHSQDRLIYEKLSEIMNLLRLEGYVPHTSNVFADIEEEEKDTALSYHSEKIAIAFMLINTAPRTPITVIKNLRVCADCHVAIKLISKIYDREIVVRDRSRFHHFKDGSCSCRDYW
ncbi:hypothetical protein Droror1_Dr00019654 [Drosera rotundifolia]